MAELLVRTKDKVSDDFYLNAQCSKRGDVITVQEDGWPWSEAELSFPEWVLLKVPGVPAAQFENLVSPEKDISFAEPSKTLQRRAFKLDLDALAIPEPVTRKELELVKEEGDLKGDLSVGGKDAPELVDRALIDKVLDSQVIDLQTYKVAKARIADPDTFGDTFEIWQPL